MTAISEEFLKAMMSDPDFKKSIAATVLHKLSTEVGAEFKKQMLHEMKSELQSWKAEYVRNVKTHIELDIAGWVGGHLKREVESNKTSVLSFVRNLKDDEETKRLISKAFRSILYDAIRKTGDDMDFKVSLDLKKLCPTDHPDPYDE